MSIFIKNIVIDISERHHTILKMKQYLSILINRSNTNLLLPCLLPGVVPPESLPVVGDPSGLVHLVQQRSKSRCPCLGHHGEEDS